MALLKCSECGGEVSSQAKACPKCGAPVALPRRTKWTTWAIGGTAAAVIASCIAQKQAAEDQRGEIQVSAVSKESSMPPEERAALERARQDAERSKEKWAAGIVKARLAIEALRGGLKDPSSFSLTKALLYDTGAICIEYRAKNSFAAIIPGIAAVAAGGTSVTFAKAEVEAICAEGVGRDITKAI